MLPTVQTGYDSYYELCLKLMRRGGLIAFDNTLWYGRVLEAGTQDPDTEAIKTLNTKLSRDTRIAAVQMNVGDGYTLVTKL